MKIVKLDKEEGSPKVTIEFSISELNVLRNLLNKSVAIDEKHGFKINRFTKTLVWELNCVRNIAVNGMIGPGDAMAWVDKLAEGVEETDDRKAKVDTDSEASCAQSLWINPETGEISPVREESRSASRISEE